MTAAIFRRAGNFRWLAALLALTPAFLFAYLGHFSRLEYDDYCTITVGRERGAWEGMVYWYNEWAGSYTNFFLKSALAPLDTLLPAIMPALIVALWLAGLTWLAWQGLACLQIDGSRPALSIGFAGLAAAASINALYSPESFYWYAASTHYTLPLTLLTLYMALAMWTARRWPSWPGLAVGAALCFLSAGAAEIFVAFQLVFFTFCLLSALAFLRPPLRPRYVRIFALAWLVTLGCLLIYLNSPGIANRLLVEEMRDFNLAVLRPTLTGEQQWNLALKLAPEMLWLIFEYIGHEQAFAGFALLMFLSLLVMLIQYSRQSTSKTSQLSKLAAWPWWLGLIFQLIFIPILWDHTSDHAQFFGRFSIGYLTVVILNTALILGFAGLLWQRRRVNAALERRKQGWLAILGIMAAVFLLLFALSQLRSIHYRAASYLFTMALVFLGLTTWMLAAGLESQSAKKYGYAGMLAYVFALTSMAAIIFTALLGRGFVTPRILAPAACLLVMSGSVWGISLGFLLRSQPWLNGIWLNWLKLGSLVIVLTVAMGIALGQAALIPDFRAFAKEWDARHQLIIAMRDEGQRDLLVPRLSAAAAGYTAATTLPGDPRFRCAKHYYGVDSIKYDDP